MSSQTNQSSIIFVLANTTISSIKSPISIPSSMIIAPKAFTDHQNLVLETADLTIYSHITTYIAIIIWIYKETNAYLNTI